MLYTWKMFLSKTGKPHLHGNMLNVECVHFKDPFLGCMIGSDTKSQGEEKIVVLLYTFGVNKVGLNQILNTHMPTISKDANYYLQQIN